MCNSVDVSLAIATHTKTYIYTDLSIQIIFFQNKHSSWFVVMLGCHARRQVVGTTASVRSQLGFTEGPAEGCSVTEGSMESEGDTEGTFETEGKSESDGEMDGADETDGIWDFDGSLETVGVAEGTSDERVGPNVAEGAPEGEGEGAGLTDGEAEGDAVVEGLLDAKGVGAPVG